MNARPPHPAGKPQPRRATRFHAVVERLDRRDLMAASITGTAIPITGNVGTPLRTGPFGQISGGPGRGGGASIPVIADYPIGTPITLVQLDTLSTTGTAPAPGYAGTVDWGDGTTADAAIITTGEQIINGSAQSAYLDVAGPDHTYATPGTFTITIAVTGPGDTTPTVFHDTATISADPVVTGQLNPTSDTGYSDFDNVTADTTPTFYGTTQPGATVVLTTTSIATNQSLVVGSGVADASGNWNITTVPFVDGTYAFSATVTSTFGGSTTQSLTGNLSFPDYVKIDATGPKVSGFAVTNFRTGAFAVYYSDPAGLLIAPAVDADLYAVSRTSPAPARGQTFAVTNLSTQATDTGTLGAPASNAFVPVVGTFTTGKPIPRNGTYVFTIYAAGVIGLSGAKLDGAYTGPFPSGDGPVAGNFQVKITVRNGVVSGPLPVGSTATKATAATVPAAAARPHVRGIKH